MLGGVVNVAIYIKAVAFIHSCALCYFCAYSIVIVQSITRIYSTSYPRLNAITSMDVCNFFNRSSILCTHFYVAIVFHC